MNTPYDKIREDLAELTKILHEQDEYTQKVVTVLIGIANEMLVQHGVFETADDASRAIMARFEELTGIETGVGT